MLFLFLFLLSLLALLSLRGKAKDTSVKYKLFIVRMFNKVSNVKPVESNLFWLTICRKKISSFFSLIVKHFTLVKLISSFITLVLVLLIKYYFYGGFINPCDLSQGFILGFSGLVFRLGILGLVEGLFEYYGLDSKLSLYDIIHKPLLVSQSTDSGISYSPSPPRPSSSSSAPTPYSSSFPGTDSTSSGPSSSSGSSSPTRPTSSSSAPASMAGWSTPGANENNLIYSVDAEGKTLISCWKRNLDAINRIMDTSTEEYLNRSSNSITTRESLREFRILYEALIHVEECKARGIDPKHTESTLEARREAIQAWHELNRFRYRMSPSNYKNCVECIEQHNANIRYLRPNFCNEILDIP